MTTTWPIEIDTTKDEQEQNRIWIRNYLSYLGYDIEESCPLLDEIYSLYMGNKLRIGRHEKNGRLPLICNNENKTSLRKDKNLYRWDSGHLLLWPIHIVLWRYKWWREEYGPKLCSGKRVVDYTQEGVQIFAWSVRLGPVGISARTESKIRWSFC